MLVVGHEIGKYLVEDFLGNGHFGFVYKVTDRALYVERALKVLEIADPSAFVELFEAQIQYKCRHENCVVVNSADVHHILGKPHACIDMELIGGGSLEKSVRDQFVSPKFATKIICDVSYGLEHAHNQGVLHKDIKPGNIMISDGIGKLSDFGISQYVGVGGIGNGMAYMTHQPPEFFIDKTISVMSDVYSLGITLFRCLNNISNWDDAVASLNNPADTLKAGSLVQDLGWAEWIPKKLRRIVAKACAPNPDNRFQSVRDFRQALERLHWQNDWVKVDESQWKTTEQQIHIARLTKMPNLKFEHLVNGRRKNLDAREFASMETAQSFLLKFVADSTLS